MEYTVHELASLAGVSSRALRYYDEIGLLKPKKINDSGYRIYGEDEINRLQHILFYREFEFKLEEIKSLLDSKNFEEINVLEKHKRRLLDKKEKINDLIENISKTIEEKEGGKKMKDKEKFKAFKQKMLDENENEYGDEVRQKYGEDKYKYSYNKVKNMTEEDHKRITALANEIIEKLGIAFKEGNPKSKLALEVADLHKQWLFFYWGQYSKEAHRGIADMYVQDERFKKYYDPKNEGIAEFLRDAIIEYTNESEIL